MEIVHESGPSGSGKTTRLVELIRRAVSEGRTVGAIKHTHHRVNDQRRGDTGRFLDAGARPVILAGDREAVVFGDTTRRIPYRSLSDLLALIGTDVVVVEGFKQP